MSLARKGCLVVTVLTSLCVMAANWTYPNTLANHFALSAIVVLLAGFLMLILVFAVESR